MINILKSNKYILNFWFLVFSFSLVSYYSVEINMSMLESVITSFCVVALRAMDESRVKS